MAKFSKIGHDPTGGNVRRVECKNLAHAEPGFWIFLFLQECLCLRNQPFFLVVPVGRPAIPPAKSNDAKESGENNQARLHFNERQEADSDTSNPGAIGQKCQARAVEVCSSSEL